MHEFAQERDADGELHLRQAIVAGQAAATAVLMMFLESAGRAQDAEQLLVEARARNDTAGLQSVEAWRRTWSEMDRIDLQVLQRYDVLGYSAISDPAVSDLLSALIVGTGPTAEQ